MDDISITLDMASVESLFSKIDHYVLATKTFETAAEDAVASAMTEVADEMTQAVRDRTPSATGGLLGSVRHTPVAQTGHGLAFSILAGRRNAQGENIGWFTELGTQDHAVDDVGYVHRGIPNPNHPGITAEHWFEHGVQQVAPRIPEIIHDALMRSYALLHV